MYIIALDCSTKSTGVAIFNSITKELLGKSCISASSTDLYKRIHKMTDAIVKIVEGLYDDGVILVMEEVIPDHSKNQHTFKALMYLQALIHIEMHDQFPKVQIELVYPGTWRSICGIKTGRSVVRETVKEADVRFVQETYGLSVKNDDEADAICIGHAFLNPKNSKALGDISWE